MWWQIIRFINKHEVLIGAVIIALANLIGATMIAGS